MVTVSLRFDEDMKRELDEMCDALGMDLSTFFMIYAKRALRDRAIPFELSAPAAPEYNRETMEALRETVDIEAGRIPAKRYQTVDALFADNDAEIAEERQCSA